MDENFRNQLIDRFEGWELIEYLQIPIEAIIDAFCDDVWEAKEDLVEFMTYGD